MLLFIKRLIKKLKVAISADQYFCFTFSEKKRAEQNPLK